MWVQTCSARERWQGEEVSRMNEQEIRMLFETVQVHAQAIINQCSTYLLRHLDPPRLKGMVSGTISRRVAGRLEIPVFHHLLRLL